MWSHPPHQILMSFSHYTLSPSHSLSSSCPTIASVTISCYHRCCLQRRHSPTTTATNPLVPLLCFQWGVDACLGFSLDPWIFDEVISIHRFKTLTNFLHFLWLCWKKNSSSLSSIPSLEGISPCFSFFIILLDSIRIFRNFKCWWIMEDGLKLSSWIFHGQMRWFHAWDVTGKFS